MRIDLGEVKKQLKEKGIEFVSITTEKGFVKLTNKAGKVCYCNPNDLSKRTDWGYITSIVIKDGSFPIEEGSNAFNKSMTIEERSKRAEVTFSVYSISEDQHIYHTEGEHEYTADLSCRLGSSSQTSFAGLPEEKVESNDYDKAITSYPIIDMAKVQLFTSFEESNSRNK